jgi:hypothetical protein
MLTDIPIFGTFFLTLFLNIFNSFLAIFGVSPVVL